MVGIVWGLAENHEGDRISPRSMLWGMDSMELISGTSRPDNISWSALGLWLLLVGNMAGGPDS